LDYHSTEKNKNRFSCGESKLATFSLQLETKSVSQPYEALVPPISLLAQVKFTATIKL